MKIDKDFLMKETWSPEIVIVGIIIVIAVLAKVLF